jgi:glutaredoxin
MMTLIEIENNLPTKNKINFDDFRRSHPHIAFGLPPNPQTLFNDFGVTTYELSSCPDASTAKKYFKFVETPVLNADKSATQTWIEVAMNNDEKKAAYDAKVTEVKAQRDAMLAASDWTQMSDVTIDAAVKEGWATYRQALRDVTKQEGYPWDITWPTLVAPT